MKKLLLSMFAFAGLTAFAGQTLTPEQTTGTILTAKSSNQQYRPAGVSSLRALACDTLSNLAPSDTLEYYFPMDTAAAAVSGGAIDGLGYFGGNGALYNSGSFFTNLAAGEKFDAPAGQTGNYVTSAVVLFSYVNVNPTTADSAVVVTAYVYDTTGTGAAQGQPGYSPGSPIDSATTTLGFIATYGGAQFVFSHQAVLSGSGFFVGLQLPQTVGDTIEVAFNNGTSGYGNAWFEAGAGGVTEWLPVDSFLGQAVGSFIFPVVCGNNTVGISQINGISNFSVYPNPSNGTFTAAINLDKASDLTISVTDMAGQKIYESTETNVQNLNKSIDLSSAAAGIYFVSVKTTEGTINQRIAIK